MSEQEIDALVLRRMDELLGRVKGISNLYVEPGDIVVVTVDQDTQPEMLRDLRRVLQTIFNQNSGVFVTEEITFQVLKRGKDAGKEDEDKEAEQEITDAKERIAKAEALIAPYRRKNRSDGAKG